MGFNFNNPLIKNNMYKGCFGIEEESLRITNDGFLSHSNNPFENEPNIDRDFCENQVEIVTDVCSNISSLYKNLTDLRNKVIKKLTYLKPQSEILWSFSNPPYVKNEADIPIADYKGSLKSKAVYRKYLAQKYGKKKMLFSGIHFNFSFADELVEYGFKESGFYSFREYKNNLYLELAKKLTKISWLIVYLFAASPVMDGSYFNDAAIKNDVVTPFSSVRCSDIGYWNDFIPILKYDSIECYVEGIREYIDKGMLKSPSELYYPIRLKPLGKNDIDNLLKTGVNHIELRMLDLNPLSPVGIVYEDICFLHLLILYLSSLDFEDFSEAEQISSVKNMKKAALFDDENTKLELRDKNICLKSAALEVLNNMRKFFEGLNQDNAVKIIDIQAEKINNKSKRYAEIIRKNYGKNYVEKGIELSLEYAENLKKRK